MTAQDARTTASILANRLGYDPALAHRLMSDPRATLAELGVTGMLCDTRNQKPQCIITYCD